MQYTTIISKNQTGGKKSRSSTSAPPVCTQPSSATASGTLHNAELSGKIGRYARPRKERLSNPKIRARRQNFRQKDRPQYDRCVMGTASRKEAIETNCKECMGDNSPEECTAIACPLYLYRPYQGGGKD